MSKLHIVIADPDEAFVDGLLRYLLTNHAERFEVSSFTEKTYLYHYLSSGQAKADMLLIHPRLLDEKVPWEGIKTVLLEEEESEDTNTPKGLKIAKYQCGDQFVNRIMELYSQENLRGLPPWIGQQKTKTIVVYSPAGGVGKTTVAMGLCIQAAWEGKSVFYLNLEDLASTELYLAGEHEQSLSNVLLYLREEKKNLARKIEEAKTTDPQYKIHYFQPPANVLDYHEDLSGELRKLVKELVAVKQYDRIIIDLSSSLHSNNLAMLEACDEVLVVCTPDMTVSVKIKLLLNELEAITCRSGLNILEKTSFLLNKYEPLASLTVENQYYIAAQGLLKIPKVDDLLVPYGEKYRIDMNSAFGTAMYQLMLRF